MMSDWKQEIPSITGDWLWIHMMQCGCCVDDCGVCFIFDSVDISYNKDRVWKNGNLCFEWYGSKPRFNGDTPMVTAWRKIDLPPHEWC
jgi:hypothetical protein